MGEWEKLDGEEVKAIDDRKRAGGLSGWSESADWWKPGGSCAMIKKMIGGLSPLERVSLFGDAEVREWVMDAVDREKAEWVRRDAEIVPKLLEAKGKAPRKKTLRAYWMRTVEGWDDTKRGSERLVGDWVMEPEAECDAGELVVVGLRYPEKRYALCVVDKASHAKLFEEVRPDIKIVGLRLVGEVVGWPEVAEMARRALSER